MPPSLTIDTFDPHTFWQVEVPESITDTQGAYQLEGILYTFERRLERADEVLAKSEAREEWTAAKAELDAVKQAVRQALQDKRAALAAKDELKPEVFTERMRAAAAGVSERLHLAERRLTGDRGGQADLTEQLRTALLTKARPAGQPTDTQIMLLRQEIQAALSMVMPPDPDTGIGGLQEPGLDPLLDSLLEESPLAVGQLLGIWGRAQLARLTLGRRHLEAVLTSITMHVAKGLPNQATGVGLVLMDTFSSELVGLVGSLRWTFVQLTDFELTVGRPA